MLLDAPPTAEASERGRALLKEILTGVEETNWPDPPSDGGAVHILCSMGRHSECNGYKCHCDHQRADAARKGSFFMIVLSNIILALALLWLIVLLAKFVLPGVAGVFPSDVVALLVLLAVGFVLRAIPLLDRLAAPQTPPAAVQTDAGPRGPAAATSRTARVGPHRHGCWSSRPV